MRRGCTNCGAQFDGTARRMHCSSRCRVAWADARRRAREAGRPAPVSQGERATACRACGADSGPHAYCDKKCTDRWHIAAKRARDAGRPAPVPGSLKPRKPRATASGRATSGAASAVSSGSFAQAVRDDPRDAPTVCVAAESATAVGARDDSLLLRAIAAGLRAVADVLDEALGADGGAA